jgi:hypothetical protein
MKNVVIDRATKNFINKQLDNCLTSLKMAVTYSQINQFRTKGDDVKKANIGKRISAYEAICLRLECVQEIINGEITVQDIYAAVSSAQAMLIAGEQEHKA